MTLRSTACPNSRTSASAAGRSCGKNGSISGWRPTRPARMSLCQNASSWAQEGLLFIRQKRFQKGSVRPRKHGKNKVWVAQWWEDGRKKSKVLGRCTTMGKSEAEAAMAVILKPQNEDAGQTQKPVYTFGVYLEQVFLPICHRKWKESTRMKFVDPRIKIEKVPTLANYFGDVKGSLRGGEAATRGFHRFPGPRARRDGKKFRTRVNACRGEIHFAS